MQEGAQREVSVWKDSLDKGSKAGNSYIMYTRGKNKQIYREWSLRGVATQEAGT